MRAAVIGIGSNSVRSLLVEAGEGSFTRLLRDREGRRHVSGGWGYLLEDAGSGFTLAREALLAIAAEADGMGPVSGLTPAALAYFGADTPRGLIGRVYAPDCGPDRIAGFARFVLEAADGGNRRSCGGTWPGWRPRRRSCSGPRRG